MRSFGTWVRRLVVVGGVGALAGSLGVGGGFAADLAYGQAVTVVGTGEKGYSGDGQPAVTARIGDSGTIDVAADGTLYLADRFSRRVRAVTPEGLIDTVPRTRALRSPDGGSGDWPRAVAAGKDGALYVAGDETVRRIAPDGSSTTLTDLIRRGEDIAVDAGGNVYVSTGGRVRKIDSAGQVTTVTGDGTLDPADAEGKPATEVGSKSPALSIAVDPRGNIYVVTHPDSLARPETTTLFTIGADGVVRTVVGGGEPGFAGDGGPATEARIGRTLGGVAVDGAGAVYFHDSANGVVRAIGTDGVIRSVAVVGGDASHRSDLAVGPGGEIYVKGGARIQKLVPDGAAPPSRPARVPAGPARFPDADPGTVHVVAEAKDVAAPPVPAREQSMPLSRLRIAEGPDGTRYYSDSAGHRVVRLASDGTGSVFAGTGVSGYGGDGAAATGASLSFPSGLDVGPDGSVYIADTGNHRIRKVDPAGVITTVAGNGQPGHPDNTSASGPAAAAIVSPDDVAVGPDGSLYLAEGQNSRVSRVAPDGTITVVAGAGERFLWEADGHPAAEAGFFRPVAVAVSREGALYVLDEVAYGFRPSVRMIDPRGIVREVAGDSFREVEEAGFGGDGGLGAAAELNNPHDIAVGPDGTLYLADTYNARIRAVDPAGVISTVAGTGQAANSDDGGPATTTGIDEPQSVSVGAGGAVHTINLTGDRIRRIERGITTTVGTTAVPAPSPATGNGWSVQDLAVDHDGTLLLAQQGRGLRALEAGGTPTWLHAGDPSLSQVTAVVAGPDGTRYFAGDGIVYRATGDEPPVRVAGGGPTGTDGGDRVDPGQPATLAHLRRISDLALSPTGTVHIATAGGAYRLAGDGTLAPVYRHTSGGEVTALAVDEQDNVYLAVQEAGQVYRIAPTEERTTIAGTGDSPSSSQNTDTDEALKTPLSPTGLAATGSGTVFISSSAGIHRVTAEGTILLVVDNPFIGNSRSTIDSLALDHHGDLYYADHTSEQLKLVVRPDEISPPFPWTPVLWVGSAVLALAAATWLLISRRRRKATPAVPGQQAQQTGPEDGDPGTNLS